VIYEDIMPEFLDPQACYFHVPSLTFYSPLRSKSAYSSNESPVMFKKS
jgi:hypothetical protein